MKKAGFIILLTILPFFFLIIFFQVLTLEIKEGKSGAVLLRKRVAPGEILTFGYVHSVDKTPVEGVFVIEGNGFLKLIETRFSSYGPGLPSGEGEKVSNDGRIVVQGGETHASFSFLFAPENRPFVIFKGQRHDLGSKLKREGLIEIRATKRSSALSFWQDLFKSKITGSLSNQREKYGRT